MKNTTLLTWFDGEKYAEGATVTNPHTQESIHLNNIELSIYDFILGFAPFINYMECHAITSDLQKANQQFLRCRDWFFINNEKAYMTLID